MSRCAFTSSTLGTQHPIGFAVGRQSSPSRGTMVQTHNLPHRNLATQSFAARAQHFPSLGPAGGSTTRSRMSLRARERAWTAPKDTHYSYAAPSPRGPKRIYA